MGDEVLYTADLVKNLVLTKTGQWLHEGKPFSNQKLKSLFFRSMEWVEDEKAFYLRIGKGRAAFKYEDTVYFVQSIDTDKNPWIAKLSDETSEPMDLNSLKLGKDNQIYCTVKSVFKARLSRSAHQAILEFAVDNNSIEVNGLHFVLEPYI